MSQDLKIAALDAAVKRAAPEATTVNIIGAAEAYFAFLTGTALPAIKAATKPAKDKAPVAETVAAPAAEVVKEEVKEPAKPTVTQDQIKAAVIKLVEAGNRIATAGGDASGKVGRGHAAGVLQPFGASNVSTVPVDKYVEVLAALEAKLVAVEAEAAEAAALTS